MRDERNTWVMACAAVALAIFAMASIGANGASADVRSLAVDADSVSTPTAPPADEAPSDSSATDSESADSTATAEAIDVELAASTAAPWLPDHPVPTAESWETAVRMPGRIVSLPLSGLGFVTKHAFIEVEESNLIPKVITVVAGLPSAGILAGPANLGDRTGWGVSLGFSPPWLGKHLSASWDGSTLKYSRTRAEARWGPVRLDYAYQWRPRERFYGLGPSSSEDDTTTFASQSQQARLGVAERLGAPERRWHADVAAWIGPREMVIRRGRGDDEPSFEQRFPSLAPMLDERVEHLVYGGRVALDSRGGLPHWSHGARLSVEAHRYDRPLQALAFRTTSVPFQFTRLVYEAEGGVSFYRDPRTLRLKLQVIDNMPDASGALLLADQATLGGNRGLMGFAPGRFHDLDAVVGRLSYIFPLATRVELDLHVEAGGVQSDVWRTTRASALEHSYGIALRPRVDNLLLGLIGVDWSDETMRVRFSIGGVE